LNANINASKLGSVWSGMFAIKKELLF